MLLVKDARLPRKPTLSVSRDISAGNTTLGVELTVILLVSGESLPCTSEGSQSKLSVVSSSAMSISSEDDSSVVLPLSELTFSCSSVGTYSSVITISAAILSLDVSMLEYLVKLGGLIIIRDCVFDPSLSSGCAFVSESPKPAEQQSKQCGNLNGYNKSGFTIVLLTQAGKQK